jgi:protein-tyrosine phosphatase
MKRLLFLCTGNYYRSRYAEYVFNALAPAAGLGWVADSRALNLAAGSNNVGPLSPFTLQRLRQRGIEPPQPLRFPLQAQDQDFAQADLVIALKRTEHEPMVMAQFPARASRVEYWQVDDIDVALPNIALARLDTQLDALLQRLAGPA